MSDTGVSGVGVAVWVGTLAEVWKAAEAVAAGRLRLLSLLAINEKSQKTGFFKNDYFKVARQPAMGSSSEFQLFFPCDFSELR